MVVLRAPVAWVAVLSVALALSGCLGGDDSETVTDPGGDRKKDEDRTGPGGGDPEEGQGDISGSVVDEGFLPIPGASVRLTQDGAEIADATTGADGRFLFEDMEAGTYRLVVTASCCRDSVERVRVRADDTATVNVQLDPRSGDEAQRPYVRPDDWGGSLGCGVNIAGAVQEAPCTDDTNHDPERHWNVTTGLRTLFVHLSWEEQPQGPELEVRLFDVASGYVYKEIDGSSPVEFRIDNDAIEDVAFRFENVEDLELGLEIAVGGDAGVVYQQGFRVDLLEFYWRQAPEDLEPQWPE